MPHTVEQADTYNDEDDALADLALVRRPVQGGIELKADRAAAAAATSAARGKPSSS
jgi:hypothetical protein